MKPDESLADQTPPVSARFAKLLRLHGYGFHAAVLKAIHGVHAVYGFGDGCRWSMLAAELPATLNGLEFHIDGVLEARADFEEHGRRFIALECKNKDKAYRDWCFARSGLSSNELVIDAYRYLRGGLTGRALRGQSRANFDIALELKSDAKQECPHGKGLQQSLNQTYRGAAGLAEALTSMPRWSAADTPAQFIVLPLLVTSADLFVTDTTLTESDLGTGREPEGLKLEKVGWVWVTQNLNRSLRPSVERDWGTGNWWLNPFAQQLRHDASRSALICSANSLDEGLRQLAVTPFDAG